MRSSTRTAWLSARTACTGCENRFYPHPLQWFGLGNRHFCSLGLYLELGSPHTAPVRCSSSQMRLVLPQAVMIGNLAFRALALTRSFRDFVDSRNLCGSSQPGTLSFPLTLFLRSSSQNFASSRIPFGCLERCGARVAISLGHTST